ncbi:MAG TPA: DUF1304 family protein [Propionibacteriaceae bacterium]|nr:DUF1304 family protein [Propionibacteriaceae bacterium]
MDLRAGDCGRAPPCLRLGNLLFQRPGVHQGVFAIPSVDVPPVRLWAFNIGFYNLFIAGGLIAGVIIWINGNESVGRAYVIYLCLFAFLAGIALFASDRLALSRPRGTGVAGRWSRVCHHLSPLSHR